MGMFLFFPVLCPVSVQKVKGRLCFHGAWYPGEGDNSPPPPERMVLFECESNHEWMDGQVVMAWGWV